MNRDPNDRIGKLAGYVLVCVLVIVFCGGLALAQTQDAIDEAVAAQQEMACFQHARMCAAVEASK